MMDRLSVRHSQEKKLRGKEIWLRQDEDKVNEDRVIERLHDFILYGSKFSVKVTRKNFVWKGNDAGRYQTPRAKPPGKGIEDSMFVKKSIAEAHSERENSKRITGHVENEDLWKLRRCLVGTMETICSVSSIYSRLTEWGLGEINVQRLWAKSYLLTILDEELFLMLGDVNWSYLKEIFSNVKPWSELTSYNERATWLEIRGEAYLYTVGTGYH
ncbi:hypothetical protein V6N13_084910 [Hibiscus sabdariffa]